MAAASQLVLVDEVGIDVAESVNIEVDFDSAEAQEILGFMSRYHIPTYADAVRLMAMIGAGTAADTSSTNIRLAAKIVLLAVLFAAGNLIDHDFGW